MTDPKYSGLPGIAHDQPDVYETSDLPESEQPPAVEVGSGEHLDVQGAFNTFRGKYLVNGSGSYELVMRSGTIKERMERLREEVEELEEEVKGLPNEGGREDVSGVGKELEQLTKRLTDAHLEQVLGPGENIPGESNVAKKLMADIKNLTSSSTTTSSSSKSKGKEDKEGKDGFVEYEMVYHPEHTQFMQASQLAALESRLVSLERALGADPTSHSVKPRLASATTTCPNISEAVNHLESQLSLLDPKILEQVEARLALTLQRLNNISEKGGVIEQTDKHNKITELYDQVKSWEKTLASLPEIKERLECLHELHEQALQFSQALTHLETVQSQVVNSLQTNEEMVKSAQDGFGKNMKTLKQMCDDIDQRINKLKK